MKKSRALELLGGSVGSAAKSIGRISSAAISQWPEDLPPRIEDRVLAALARKYLPPEMLGDGVGASSVGGRDGGSAHAA